MDVFDDLTRTSMPEFIQILNSREEEKSTHDPSVNKKKVVSGGDKSTNNEIEKSLLIQDSANLVSTDKGGHKILVGIKN